MKHHAINIGLVLLSSAYAGWLDTNKSAEPDHTWAEVVFGVGYTLAGAHLHNRVTRGDWRSAERHIIEAFCYSGAPIIAGELWQAWERRQERKAFEVKYKDILQ